MTAGAVGDMRPPRPEGEDGRMEFEFAKLEIFVSESHLDQVRDALRSVDAGHIGRYDSCLSYGRVVGQWRPLDGCDPYIGTVGEVCEQPELKVECTVRIDDLERTVAAVREAHPYEEPVINAVPLLAVGLG